MMTELLLLFHSYILMDNLSNNLRLLCYMFLLHMSYSYLYFHSIQCELPYIFRLHNLFVLFLLLFLDIFLQIRLYNMMLEMWHQLHLYIHLGTMYSFPFHQNYMFLRYILYKRFESHNILFVHCYIIQHHKGLMDCQKLEQNIRRTCSYNNYSLMLILRHYLDNRLDTSYSLKNLMNYNILLHTALYLFLHYMMIRLDIVSKLYFLFQNYMFRLHRYYNLMHLHHYISLLNSLHSNQNFHSMIYELLYMYQRHMH